MKREYAAYICQVFSEEIDEMSYTNNCGLRRGEKDRKLHGIAKKIVSGAKYNKTSLAPVFYQLKNIDGGEEKLRDAWVKSGGQKHNSDIMEKLMLHSPIVNIGQFPGHAWLLTVEFTLESPYVSQDDNPFYMLENPVRREWVFKVPYISSSQWKGMLRSVLSYRLASEAGQLQLEDFAKKRLLLTLLFGDEKGEGGGNGSNLAGFLDGACKEAAEVYKKMACEMFEQPLSQGIPSNRGSLYFYPTYFSIDKANEAGFEIINPHSRVTGSGLVPFHLETVPTGSKGKVIILYVPQCKVSDYHAGNTRDSLKLVTEGLHDLFMCHGIGAKTSSGFGTINTEKGINGNLQYGAYPFSTKVSGGEQSEPIPEEYKPFFDENKQVKDIFFKQDGKFYSNKEYRTVSEKTEISLAKYKSFRNWYQQKEGTAKTSGDEVTGPGYSFFNLKELIELPLIDATGGRNNE